MGGTHTHRQSSLKWEKGWSKDKVFDAMKVNGYTHPPPETFSEGESEADTNPISPNNALTVGDSKMPTVPTLKSRTASYSGLATLGKDAPSGPIPLGEKKKESIDIDKAFPPPRQAELEQQLHKEWTKGISTDFTELIHKLRPSWTRDEVGEFFAQLIEEGKMGYDPEGFLVWVK